MIHKVNSGILLVLPETLLTRTLLSDADAPPGNVIDGAAPSILEQDLVQSRCAVPLLRIPCPNALLMQVQAIEMYGALRQIFFKSETNGDIKNII